MLIRSAAAIDQHDDHEVEDHDRGLAFDLPNLIDRRRALSLLAGGVGLATLAACGSSTGDRSATIAPAGSGAAVDGTAATTGVGSATTAAASGGATEIPDETSGPFPADGSNGVDVLSESGVVRRDITGSFAGASGVAAGVPTIVKMTLLDVAGGGSALSGAAVYLWHCDIDGRYSMYDRDVEDENYLWGVQESDARGKVTFTTVFPGAYSGRWPHMHFEVFESLDAATSGGTKLKTSQLAVPPETCEMVFAADGYEQSVENLAGTSLERDTVFSDGYASQVPTASGDVDGGITLQLNVGV